MGLMSKLKEILFDEEPVEIPVITKNEEKKEKKPVREIEKSKKEEVIVHKIEADTSSDEDLFDMPKLKEEAKKEVQTSNFTFPVFEDDEVEVKTTRREKNAKEATREDKRQPKTSSRKYEYLSSTDYKSRSESRLETKRTTTSLQGTEKKPFTLSPIISPVYGILNENYKKEDIVSRSETTTRLSAEKLDLDSVRRKAYGTLEDEIESTLSKPAFDDVLEEVPSKAEQEKSDDEGITIDDLLVEEPKSYVKGEEELFDLSTSSANEEIELEDEDKDEKRKEKKDNKENKEALGEEDLFDLIDSLYAGKGDN